MNTVYVPGYTLEDQRAGRPMTIAQALDIAELASPNPWSAAHALRTLRQALEQATTTLSEVRDAAGAECTYPFADLPQVVAELRRKAVDAQHTAALRAFANAVMGNWPLDGVYGDELQEFAVGVAVMSLTPEQLHILQDPLGMNFATPGEDRFADLRALVEAGLMVDAGSHPRSGGMHLFTITDAGERLVEELARGAQ